MIRLLGLLAVLFSFGIPARAADRPNILWFIVDDMSANFGCYGETAIATPNVDKLAREGTLFKHAYVTCPVCSPCRSALITGMFQTSIGSHNHRSGRGELKINLPADVKPLPVLFQQAGYYTCIGGWPTGKKGMGKTDYNFEWDRKMYDGTDWSGRKPGQPFFMQVQVNGGKAREGKGLADNVTKALGSTTPKDKVKLPPYYPNDPVVVNDWAAYLDSCRWVDHQVGEVVARLAKEGLLENTLVCFMTDHGISHARGKQFLYDEGIHVPLIVRGPGVEKGQARTDLVQSIDLSALSLAAGGIPVPANMQGRNILAAEYKPGDAVFSARDRCDETVDHIRCVRTDEFKYIRNYLPERPHLQPCRYKDNKPILKAIRAAHDAGKLDALQERILFAPKRAPEELYDLKKDPHETDNLAAKPEYMETLAKLRKRLADWEEATGDKGRQPEPEAMYDSDMKTYLAEGRQGVAIIQSNIDLMKKWAKEGK